MMPDYPIIVEATLVLAAMGAVVAYLRILDRAGGLIAVVIGYVVYLTIGRLGIAIMITFLIVSGLASRYKYDYKRSLGAAEEKGGKRGWRNVVGNGLFPAISATFYGLSPVHREAALAAFIGSASAVFADTMATEVGLLYKGSPRLVIGLRETSPGIPGAVSPYGFAGIFISSAILSGVVLLFQNPFPASCAGGIIGLVLISGIAGSSVDSVAGQLLQGIYRCERCGRTIESRTHCEARAMKVRGLRIIDNHVVNMLCSLVGCLIAAALVLGLPTLYSCYATIP